MITIDVLTTTRAEYGLMRPLIRRLSEDKETDMHLIVTGTHLDENYGLTYREIEDDGFPIYCKIPVLGKGEGPAFVSETMANALKSFTEFFLKEKPDFLLVDGDRYETMAVCTAAFNCNIPIIHLGGGDTTEGAADEFYRHAITKMAYLHFPTTEEARKRIIQLGEDPSRVFMVGSLAIENILTMDLLSRADLEKEIGFSLDKPYGLVTFHPVTLENQTAEEETEELLKAMDDLKDFKFIVTMANADSGGKRINEILKGYAENRTDRILCVDSLGSLRYLSAMKHCAFVLGNSSSGLLEAPSFKIPTINIGDRQKGRTSADSVINCTPDKESILKAVSQAMSPDFREVCRNVVNPNGDGNTSVKITEDIKNYCADHKIDLKKKFFDLA